MKIAFDFVCDETPLFAEIGHRLRREGHDTIGLTMGKRWITSWQEQFKTFPIDVDFSRPIDFVIDDELARLRKEYGQYARASSFLQADRFLTEYSRRKQSIALITTFRAVERALKVERPDIFFSTGVAYLYNLVTLAVCDKLGIPHASFYDTRGNTYRFTVSLGRGECWDLVDREYNHLAAGGEFTDEEYHAAETYLRLFREKASAPPYMNTAKQGVGFKLIFLKEFMVRMRRWYIDGWGREKGDYLSQTPWWYARRDFNRILRAQWIQRFAKATFDPIREGDNYFLYPIHLQPEASTLVLAQWYDNQLDTIKNISRALPLDRILYVKEHRSALGYNTLGLYREIKKLHNVRLIAPTENAYELIRNSQGVIVLSGTMGWEALMLNKPVYVLGEIFYQIIKGADPIRSFDELEKKLADDKAERIKLTGETNDEHVIRYLIAIARQSFDGLFTVAKMDYRDQVMSEENISNMYTGMCAFIERIREYCAESTSEAIPEGVELSGDR